MQQRRDMDTRELVGRLSRREADADSGADPRVRRESMPVSAAAPPAARATAIRRQALSQQLRTPEAVRRAFLLVEILGLPRALRPWREPADQL